jgi:hypothetical protein
MPLGAADGAAFAHLPDKLADEEVERLALSCPTRTSKILARGAGGADDGHDSDGRVFTAVSYHLDLAPEDRIVWAASYLRDRRLGMWAPGRGELDFEMRVKSGHGADAGKVYRLRRTVPVTTVADASCYVEVLLTRQTGDPPFRLEVELPRPAALTTASGGAFGVEINSDEEARLAPRPVPSLPPFQPPPELMAARAPAVLMEACPDAHGIVEAIDIAAYYAATHVHPRQMAAALEWLRALRFAPLLKDAQGDWRCFERLLEFDRAFVPTRTAAGGHSRR